MGRARRRSEDEFEETLSLIDLPITPIRSSSDHHQSKSSINSRFPVEQEDVLRNRACSNSNSGSGDDFKFGSFTGSPSTQMEMSTADELFLHGRILPLRLSVDSKMTSVSTAGRPEHGSDSVSQGRSSSVGFTSNSSSRSSSYSSTSSLRSVNNAVKTTTTTTTYTPKIRNQFHAHPSPSPQIRGGQQKSHRLNRHRKYSSVWDLFRLGPVHVPEVELNDLKQRKPNRMIHSFISKKNSDLNDQINVNNKKETLRQRLSAFGGYCRCSVDDVENVQSRIVVMKSSNIINGEEAARRSMGSDFQKREITEELRRKLEVRKQRAETEDEPSRRTFEWLKQLSIGGEDGADNLITSH